MEGRQVIAVVFVAVLLAAGHLGSVDCQLSSTFYSSSCANVDSIVKNAVLSAMNQSQIVGPSVLRLFAHDCFVGGCDGSILLQDSSTMSNVERDASDNLSLQQLAFDTINQAKAAVEAQCPGVVSCADILTMASQDVVNQMGGPSWSVLLGRRDGVNSSATAVPGHIPGSNMTVSQMMRIFSSIGLSHQDLVVLSGAHTVGFAHCDEFTDRLYDFNNVSGAVDPSISSSYASTLQGNCPNGTFSNTTVQALDTQTPAQFDNDYYQQLQTGQGTLFSDQVLFVDNTTTSLVTTYANNETQFFNDFIASMIAMSQVNVLTGSQGEIRTNCAAVNSNSSSSSPAPAPASPPPPSPPPPSASPPPPPPSPPPPPPSPPPPPPSPPPPPPTPSPPPPSPSPPPPPGGRRRSL